MPAYLYQNLLLLDVKCYIMIVNILSEMFFFSWLLSLVSVFLRQSAQSNCLYKSLFFTCYPGYLRNMFSLWSVSYRPHVIYILSLPSTKSTTYGLRSFSYMASKLWNSLLDSSRTSDFSDFQCKILQYDSFFIVKFQNPIILHN